MRQSAGATASTFLALVTLIACNGRAGQERGAPAPVQGSGATQIALERTACFGGCPVYRLTIDETGLVQYEGIAFVAHSGTDSARIAPERVRHIVDAAHRLGYFDLAESYRMDDATCPQYFPDAPSVITSVAVEGRSKRVVVDQGCAGFPRAVPELAELIDDVVQSRRWIGQ